MAYTTISPEAAAGYMTPTFVSLKERGFNPKTVLDIGAAHGHFYHICRRVWQNAKYTVIEGNTADKFFLDGLGVEVHYQFLGARDEIRDVYFDKTSPVGAGTSIYRENTPYFSDDRVVIAPTQIKKLDTLLPNRKFDFIKIDTQGSELDILIGGYEKLVDATVIMLECSFVNYNNNAPLIDDVIKFMQFHGFMMFDVTGPTMGGHLMNSRKIQCDVIFINKIKKEWLVL